MNKNLKRILRTMKIAFFILFVIVCQVFAVKGNSQNAAIKLSSNTMTINKLFSEIEKQTDYLVVYSDTEINPEAEVSVSKKSTKVSDCLNEALKSSDLKYEFSNDYIIVSKAEAAYVLPQQNKKEITGIVKDETGEPIIGANVTVKGTTIGTTTDFEGKFILNIPEDAIIAVSYIGYTPQEISTKNKSYIDVNLAEDTQSLEEVVVIGYGTAKKKDLTGSVVRADLNTLKESPNVSLGSSLQGTVPGLNVGTVTTAGSDPGMSIRGRNSISGSTSPLIVLDGIIYRGNLVDINTNDIESIDVLKDASAAAIYGSQASNGVLLITSKTVKAMSKPIIEYSGSFSLQNPTNSGMRPVNAAGFIQRLADWYISESRTGEDMLSPNPSWDVTKYLNSASNSALEGYYNGTDTNWWKLLTKKNPYIQTHDISVRGRSELSSYFLSLGYTDQDNIVIRVC